MTTPDEASDPTRPPDAGPLDGALAEGALGEIGLGNDGDGALDDATAERLLSGEAAGHELLAAVLALTTAPPRPAELAGERAALTAFRTEVRNARAMASADTQVFEAVDTGEATVTEPVVAEAGEVVDGPRPGTLRARLRFRRPGSRLLTAKISAVAALAVLGGSGLTLAASTGHLPGQRPAGRVATTPSGPASGSQASNGPRPSGSGSGPGASGAPGMAPAEHPGTGPNAPDGHQNGGAATRPSTAPSASSSPRPSWFPSAWPSWLPRPSPTQPAGRPSPTGKPKGH